MNKRLAAALLLALAPAVARPADEAPLPIAYYYKVRWGFQAEFERLFLKNHLPLLLAQKEQGRIKAVNLYRPTFHGDGHSDWTFLVVLTFPGWSTFATPSGEEELAKKIFPDQDDLQEGRAAALRDPRSPLGRSPGPVVPHPAAPAAKPVGRAGRPAASGL